METINYKDSIIKVHHFKNFPMYLNPRKCYCCTNFTNNNIEVSFGDSRIKLPKLKWTKVKIHREFTGKIKSATISQVPSGKYFVSILIETEHISMEPTGCMIGIDLGMSKL